MVVAKSLSIISLPDLHPKLTQWILCISEYWMLFKNRVHKVLKLLYQVKKGCLRDLNPPVMDLAQDILAELYHWVAHILSSIQKTDTVGVSINHQLWYASKSGELERIRALIFRFPWKILFKDQFLDNLMSKASFQYRIS